MQTRACCRVLPALLLGVAAGIIGTGRAVAADEILNFRASGTFTNGNILGGDVTINITTGAVTAANLTATGPDPQLFNTNVGAIPNYAGSGLTVIVANSPTPNQYPILLLGLSVSNLIGFLGGSISSASNYTRSDNSQVSLSSGMLTLASPNKIVTFGASGTFNNGNILSGTVIIDVTTGNVIRANFSATGPDPQTFNTNVSAVPNYAGSGLTVIVANSPTPSQYPILLLGLPVADLVGYNGGSISPASTYTRSDNSRVGLISGVLIASPEPSALALLTLGSGVPILWMGCRRIVTQRKRVFARRR